MSDPLFGTAADPVIGDPLKYAIQDFTLSSPNGTNWTLTIDTNYGTDINGVSGAMPGFCDTGTPFPSCPGSIPLFMSDVIIEQGGNTYGIVLSTHVDIVSGYTDNYVASNLYSSPGPDACPVLPAHGIIPGSAVICSQHFNPGYPVILNGQSSAATLAAKLNIGSGVESAVANAGCNGRNCAEFKITDTFTTASPFFNASAPYTIDVSSADCDNASLVLGFTPVPEPKLVWLLPALLGIGGALRRRSLVRVK